MNSENPVPDFPDWLNPLAQYLESHTGLFFKESQFRELARNFEKASQYFGYKREVDCLNWLIAGAKPKEVLAKLASFFTIGETYFFREKNHFEPMTRKILEDVIERKVRGGDRRIRIWSAACSTGEEPYSIAILLNELLPLRDGWDIRIKASDLNAGSLQRAREGRYRKWSFRGTPDWVIQKHFHVNGEEYALQAPVKEQVEFELMNLAEENFPGETIREGAYDVIFCRNVLIYFTDAKATEVARRLKGCLANDGWLVVSPPELGFVEGSGMTRHLLGNSIFHQKRMDPTSRAISDTARPKWNWGSSAANQTIQVRRKEEKPARLARSKPTEKLKSKRNSISSNEELVKAVENALNSGNAEAAIQMLSPVIKDHTTSGCFPALMARALLKTGDNGRALPYIQRATKLEKTNSEYHCIEGVIHLELQDLAQSKSAFERALYIDPQHCKALYYLGNIERQAGREEAAKLIFVQLKKYLSMMPGDRIVFEEDDITAGNLLNRVDHLFISATEKIS